MARTLGGKYPISLGSAAIFECYEFDIKQWPDYFYVNLRTLYRNYVASIPREEYHRIKETPFFEDFLNEVQTFESIVKDVSGGRVSIFFYYPTYQSINKLLPKIDRKEYNPEMFDDIEENMWRMMKQRGVMIPFHYETIDCELPALREPILLLSSFVVDLLSYTNFPMLSLIESYTGKIKKRQEWYTKINLGNSKLTEGTKIPFNKFTIQVFGDKSGALRARDRNLRILVRKLAHDNNWSPLTTTDKIKYCIGKIKDFKVKELLFSYL